MTFGCDGLLYYTILERHQLSDLIKNKAGPSTDMNFLGGKMVKIFERLHMPLNQKMKFVQKMVIMSSTYCFIAETVTDSADDWYLMQERDVENLMTLCEADITTKNPSKFKNTTITSSLFEIRLLKLKRDHVRKFQPPISGKKLWI
jgi:tRNA nucleotidyltransferase (CCA-adding enzyme)